MGQQRVYNGMIYEDLGNGQARVIGPANQPPVDPTFPYRGPAAALDVQAKRAGMQNDAARVAMDRARLDLARQQAALQQQQDALKIAAAQKEEDAKSPYNPQQIDAVKTDAWNKLQTLDRIGENYQGSTLPAIGFGAETLSGVGGTGAANVKTNLEELKAGGALSEVMKMTQATGKNPFTPMSNSDVALVAKNVAGVEQSQTPKEFFRSIKPYRNAYVNAYAGAVGAETLNNEIDRQTGVWKSQNPRASARQVQVYRSTLTELARQNYERTMRAKRQARPQAPRQSRVVDFNDLP